MKGFFMQGSFVGLFCRIIEIIRLSVRRIVSIISFVQNERIFSEMIICHTYEPIAAHCSTLQRTGVDIFSKMMISYILKEDNIMCVAVCCSVSKMITCLIYSQRWWNVTHTKLTIELTFDAYILIFENIWQKLTQSPCLEENWQLINT